MGSLFEVVGRLHPALVHLPIGILILSVVFIWLDALQKINLSRDVMKLTTGLGAVFAILSVLSGLLLSREDEYEEALVQWHQWLGITTAVASVALWRIRPSLRKWASVAMLLLVVVTGHLGASITHGTSYLTAPLSGNSSRFDVASVDYDSAGLYSGVIAPILQQNCYGCHGPSRQKGKLRLDAPGHISAGGKDGPVINAGNPQQSELMERLRLPLDDEHHMPPKEKRQPGETEIALIALWIESGASFDYPLRNVVSRDKWESLIAGESEIAVGEVPTDKIGEADQQILSDLRAAGVSVSPVAAGSNYLQLSFIAVPDRVNTLLPMIRGVADNIVWLRLGHTKLDDSMMSAVAGCRNLRRLGIERTLVTDEGLAALSVLNSLVVLNLAGTKTSITGLRSIAGISSLTSLNLYQTSVQDAGEVKQLFPNTLIEFGGYDVPFLPSDTVVVK
jgi:uncharacterized membrane protein